MRFVAMKIVKSAEHYTEAAKDEIKVRHSLQFCCKLPCKIRCDTLHIEYIKSEAVYMLSCDILKNICIASEWNVYH